MVDLEGDTGRENMTKIYCMSFQLKGKKKKQGVGGTLAHPAEEPGSALTPVSRRSKALFWLL